MSSEHFGYFVFSNENLFAINTALVQQTISFIHPWHFSSAPNEYAHLSAVSPQPQPALPAPAQEPSASGTSQSPFDNPRVASTQPKPASHSATLTLQCDQRR